MTTRRAFLGSLAGGLLALPGVAHAQPAEKARRLGYLSAGSPIASPRSLEAFRDGLRALGWVEGQNIAINERFAEGKFARLPDLARELVRLPAEVIVAVPTVTAVAAKKATATIPIVMINAADPVELGLVASLAQPGGNVTGVAYSVGMDTIGKGLELLKKAVPKVRRVAVLSNPANPAQPLATDNLEAAARALGLKLQLLQARAPSDFDGALAAMARERVGALLVVSDSMFSHHRAQLADLVAQSRLPTMYGDRDHVDTGGLMSYGVSFVAQFRRAAVFVDKILKGAKPADLPVEQPTKFELVINLKTARTLGLTIPQSLLARADEVIR